MAGELSGGDLRGRPHSCMHAASAPMGGSRETGNRHVVARASALCPCRCANQCGLYYVCFTNRFIGCPRECVREFV